MNSTYKAKFTQILFADSKATKWYWICALSILTGPFSIIAWIILGPQILKRVMQIKKVIETGEVTEVSLIKKKFSFGNYKVSFAYKINGIEMEGVNNINTLVLRSKKNEKFTAVYNPKDTSEIYLTKFYKAKPKNKSLKPKV